MDWQERIIVDPKILVGKPVMKGTRLAGEFVVELLSQGWTEGEILRLGQKLLAVADQHRRPGVEWHGL